MLAYYFRFYSDNPTAANGREPTGYVGLAVAPDQFGMFWEIDQYGDPYRCEIMTARQGSFCCLYTDNEDDDCWETAELELGETMPSPECTGWSLPIWSKPEKFTENGKNDAQSPRHPSGHLIPWLGVVRPA